MNLVVLAQSSDGVLEICFEYFIRNGILAVGELSQLVFVGEFIDDQMEDGLAHFFC